MHKKSSSKIFLLIIMILCSVIFLSGCDELDDVEIAKPTSTTSLSSANNELKCPICGHIHDYDKLDFLGEVAYNMTCSVWSPDLFNFYNSPVYKANPDKYKFADEGDTIVYYTSTTFSTMYNDFIKPTYETIALFGEMLVFLYFLLELAEVSLNDGFTPETLARYTIKTLISFLVIRNGLIFIKLGLNTVTYIYEMFNESDLTMAAPGSGSCIFNLLTSSSIWLSVFTSLIKIAYILTVFLAYSVLWVLSFLIQAMMWVRIFELIVRILFAPIGLADFAKGGTHSNGVRYFKKLMAVALQGVCMFAVLVVFKNICGVLLESGLGGFFGMIVLGFAMIGTLKKTGDIANEILGV